MWNADTVEIGRLARALNGVEHAGGTVFQIIETDRKGVVCVVWHDHDRPTTIPGIRVGTKKR